MTALHDEDGTVPDRTGISSATALSPDEPMTDTLCLFVHSLALDQRPVPPQLLARAAAWAAAHPHCGRAVRDLERVREVLATEPVLRTGPDFTRRVLDTAARQAMPARVLPLVRRLSVAAALLLGITLAFDLHFPGGAEAGADLARQPHVMDTLRPDPFATPRLEHGLRALLPDPPPLGDPAAAEVDQAGEEGGRTASPEGPGALDEVEGGR